MALVRLVLSLLLGLLVLGGCAEALPSEGAVRAVSVPQAAAAYEEVDDLVVLDVRTQSEYDLGHVPGAVLLDFYADDFREQVAQLDRGGSYLVYCASGNRSGSTGGIMQELEFADVRDMTDGFSAWAGAGLPVER